MKLEGLDTLSGFDKAALTYDEEFESLPATKRLRRKVWDIYYRYFTEGDTLLELNCGTGTDAIELASNGMHIVATDASVQMIAATARKIRGTALNRLIRPIHLSFHQLSALYGAQFDGAYSNLGGLNCTSRLDRVAADLAVLVKPGKHVILCLMSDFSLWETLAFMVRGKLTAARRRKARFGVLADIKGEKVWVHYYSPAEVQRRLSPFFELVEMRGLNIFSPPPTSRFAHQVLGGTVHLIEALEDTIPSNTRIQAWGDHVVYVFRRRD